MRLPGTGKKRNQPPVDVRRMVLAALASAMEDGRRQPAGDDKKKKGLTGVRAVAAGAALVTAGRVAYRGRELIRERLQSDDDQPAEEEEEPEAEAEEDFEDEEPEAEEDEEPEAEADEEPEAEEDEEPEAEADE